MTKKKLNRRDWMKKSLLTAGSFMVAPYVGFSSNTTPIPLTLDANGNAIYSPLFKEFFPNNPSDFLAVDVRLNANENPYGPSPMALEAFKKNAKGANRYAWQDLMHLKEKIAKYEGVSAKNIVLSAGSTDLLEKTGILISINGGNIISADPTFMTLVRAAKASGASWKAIPLRTDWSHDLKAMESAIDADTKLVYICNPNNPTGTIINHEELKHFCSRVSDKVPVFVDEAYQDFLDDGHKKSMVSLINEGKNIIVARTFSKIYGMAGMRVGYVVTNETMAKKLQKLSLSSMGVTYPSVFAASAAMEDTAFISKSRKLNADCREFVYNTLKDMGIDYVPSHTSFIIFPIEMEGRLFLQEMRRLNVGVRAFQFDNKTWCRVSMGKMEEMKIFVKALKQVLM